MRGSRRPAVVATATDTQRAFRALSRHRRTKLARAASTTLVKADQWGRGEHAAPEVGKALEQGVQALQKKAK
jgi:hypothetical protein